MIVFLLLLFIIVVLLEIRLGYTLVNYWIVRENSSNRCLGLKREIARDWDRDTGDRNCTFRSNRHANTGKERESRGRGRCMSSRNKIARHSSSRHIRGLGTRNLEITDFYRGRGGNTC